MDQTEVSKSANCKKKKKRKKLDQYFAKYDSKKPAKEVEAELPFFSVLQLRGVVVFRLLVHR